MRIGIDGSELASQRTGVGRYLSNLCRLWSQKKFGADHEFLVYTPKDGEPVEVAEWKDSNFHNRPVNGRPGVWWEQVTLPRMARHDRLDVFFGPSYSVPLALQTPRVVTLHDISFAIHPEWFSKREGLRRRWLAYHAIGVARFIIAVSRFSRQEIIRYYDVDPKQVSVVHNGIHRLSVPSSVEQSSLVLYVGSLFNRRHLPTLIAAFAKIIPYVPDAKLAIVGSDRTYPRQNLTVLAETAGVADRVMFRSYVSDDILAALYAEARVFAYLSEYEGFGMTPLEAIAAGVPIVVGDTPVAREVYGDAAHLVPVDNSNAVADALMLVLRDETTRSQMIKRHKSVLSKFTWERSARETLSLLQQAATSPS